MSYADNRISADKMIAAKGMPVTITRRTNGAYNPATGAATVSLATETGKGVIFDFSTGLRKLSNGSVLAQDRQLILSAVGVSEPQIDDKINAGGVDYAVIDVSPLSPAGTDIIYTCTIRGVQ